MRKEIPEQRRAQLINAAVETIGEVGLADITLSQVAKEAGMSTGIVSHYFGDKEGLLKATMSKILRDLHDDIVAYRARANSDPRSQLFAIINGNFAPSQTSETSMRTWLNFWSASMYNADLRRLQRINDHRLYSNICFQFQRALPQASARKAARGLAAMIDGLWLRSSLTGEQFDVQQASLLARDYIDYTLAGHATGTRSSP